MSLKWLERFRRDGRKEALGGPQGDNARFHEVALPITKPIRRGGFLIGSDGERHWVDYKYERLPVFCHFCGILGHDLKHCPAHYEESKRSTALDYQYGDWLKATNGRNRSPLRQRTSTHGAVSLDKEDNQTVERNEREATAKSAARVLAPRDLRTTQSGNNELHGVDLDIQPKIVEGIAQVPKCLDHNVPILTHGEDDKCMDSHVPKVVQAGNSETKLRVDTDHGPEEGNKEVGLPASRPTKQMGKWTRINRMEVGPNDLTKSNSMPTLGKRVGEDALFVSAETGEAACTQKRSKVRREDGEIDSTLAGVIDHPCREQ